MEWYEEDEVCRALKEFIAVDKDLEMTKQMISLKSDFNLIDAYNIFDLDQKKYVTIRELEEGYNVFKLYPNK